MNTHNQYMQRCLDLAANGLGTTYPNPLVGSVIVANQRIIGEGWHKKAGEDHAEVVAIKSVKEISNLENSTLYVNLEPCSHHGKTPPCVDLILKHKIKNVVIGSSDPNPLVAGRGIKKLIDAGVNVTVGILEKECKFLNRRFFTFQQKQRPYIILKWAQSADGFIAPNRQKHDPKSPVWISNALSQQLVHKWRTEEQSILIGTNTAVDDNPQLTSRSYFGRNPIRIVVDRALRIPKENYIFDNQAETILISSVKCDHNSVISETIDFNQNIAKQILEILFQHNIASVIIEGGKQTLQTFIDSDFWDEARVFKSKNYLKDGIKAPNFAFIPKDIQRISDDELLTFQHD